MDTAENEKVLGSDRAGVMRAVGSEAEVDARASGGRTRRRKFTEAIWAKALPEYFGGAPAREVCARYGMSLQTLYLRVGGAGKRAQARERRERRQDLRETTPAPSQGDGVASRGAAAGEDGGVLALLAALFAEVARQLLALTGTRVETSVGADGRVRMRRHHSKEVWAEARKDYEGGATAPAVAERYGMTEHAVKRRSRVEGWCKTVKVAAPPLVKRPDPAQMEVDAAGAETSAWARIAHPAQRPPEFTANGEEWRTWTFQGGRGAGKTRAGAEWLAERALASAHGRFALVGPTLRDVREVMIEGPSGIRNLPGRERPQYEASRGRLAWRNGAEAFAFSAEEPERLRGPQFEAAWADEFCTWPKPEHTLAMLRMGLRLGKKPQLVVTTTPRPVASLRRLRAEASCVVTQAPTSVNAANLSETFLSGLYALYGGTRLAEQELEGVMVEGEGALWRADDLARVRGARPAALERVIVAVDPPASAGGVCGIVAAGRAGGRAYVLEDASALGLSPIGWAGRVAETVKRHGAAKVVAEANQGGDMVRTTLRTAGVSCPVDLVHAAHGKRMRAEPVALVYEQGRVTHCGTFAALEEEMLSLGVGEGRLDRADALVWALTSLMLGPRTAPPKAEWL